MANLAQSRAAAAFDNNDYAAAVKHFSAAIALSPAPDHRLFSDRSRAYSMRSQYTRASRDAEEAVSLKPDSAMPYYRLGVAQAGLHNFESAVFAYKKGLEIEPNNEEMLSAFYAASIAASIAAAESGGGAAEADRSGPFSGPEVWTELEADWRTRSLLLQEDFIKKLTNLQRNPKLLNLKDNRFACAIGVIMTAKMRRDFFGDPEDQRKVFAGFEDCIKKDCGTANSRRAIIYNNRESVNLCESE